MNGESMTGSERALIEQCMLGRQDAYRQLYDLYKDRVFTIAVRTLGNAEDAEDALQETFVKVFRHIGSFQWKSLFSTWIHRITVNTSIEIIRKRKKHLNHLDIDEFSEILTVESSFGKRSNFVMMLEKEIQKLPEGYKNVFVLYAIEGYKHHEIAEMLDITEGTSKSQYFQARTRLRKQLLPHMEVIKNGMS